MAATAVGVVILCAVAAHAQDVPPLHDRTFKVPPQQSLTAPCPVYLPDGTTTTRYTTPAAEGNALVFNDPLPPDAVIESIAVTVPMLASALPSRTLELALNPSLPDVVPAEAALGSVEPNVAFACNAHLAPFLYSAISCGHGRCRTSTAARM